MQQRHKQHEKELTSSAFNALLSKTFFRHLSEWDASCLPPLHQSLQEVTQSNARLASLLPLALLPTAHYCLQDRGVPGSIPLPSDPPMLACHLAAYHTASLPRFHWPLEPLGSKGFSLSPGPAEPSRAPRAAWSRYVGSPDMRQYVHA
jgi:hypothetical protein